MIAIDDIAEVILEALRSNEKAAVNYREALSRESRRDGKWGFQAAIPFNKSYTSLPAKRIFLSERDVKKLLGRDSKKLTVAKAAIISPLAQEWLETKGVCIEYR